MEYLTLDREQQKRARVLTQLIAGRLNTTEAASALGLSKRQIERLRPSFRQRGPESLVHGNLERRPANRISSDVREQILELAKSTYLGFNFQHLTEMLREVEGIDASADTVRRVCLDAGVRPPRPQRRRAPRRQRRERCSQEGEMLQMDGSKHPWLEERGPKLTLINAIDDATGRKWARFFEEETLEGYMVVLGLVIRDRGVPLAAYTDGISTVLGGDRRYRQQPPTATTAQLRRAFNELGVVSIVAGSPQAKGRVERTNGMDQDRLTSLLRLHGAASLSEANQVLPRYLRDVNRRFAVAASNSIPAWLPRPAIHLDDILCMKEERLVSRDNTVRVYGRIIDIPAGSPKRDYAGCRVHIHRRFDGSLAVHFEGRRIAGTPPAPFHPRQPRPTESLQT